MLASQAWNIGLLDDQGSIEPCTSSSLSEDSESTNKWHSAISMQKNEAQETSTYSGIAHSKHQESSNNNVKLNRACIRRFVNVFLAFYRSMHLWEIKQLVEVTGSTEAASADCGIRIHHIVAASDDFNKLSMHWDLMPAAKLNYVHDFRGFFNCISQVGSLLLCVLNKNVYVCNCISQVNSLLLCVLNKNVYVCNCISQFCSLLLFILCTPLIIHFSQVIYFHDPDYERRPQERKRVQEVSRGMASEDGVINALQIIPPLMQMFPEIELDHADEAGGSLLSRACLDKKYTWLFCGHTVYMVAPPLASCGGVPRVLYSGKDVAPLLQVFWRETSKT